MHSLDAASWEVQLARWWRRRVQESSSGEPPSKKKAPSAMSLLELKHTSEAKAFLRQRVEEVENQLDWSPDAVLYFSLGSLFFALEDMKESRRAFEAALRQPCKDKRAKARIQRDLDVVLARLEAEEALAGNKLPTRLCTDVERRSNLTVKEFWKDYATLRKPVIITDAVDGMFKERLTLDTIQSAIGDRLVTLRQPAQTSGQWAKMNSFPFSMPLKDYAERFSSGFFSSETAGSQRYCCVFDWSLPLHAPELLRDYIEPGYFSQNLLRDLPSGTKYARAWPSLFLSPKGQVSDLHVDSFGSHFWMGLLEGEKEWTFFDRLDLGKLYPTGEIFEVDVECPDEERHPLFKYAKQQKCTLKAGELLFVPSGSPHFVRTTENSIAISSNYVDFTNYDHSHAVLSKDSLCDEHTKELLKELESAHSRQQTRSAGEATE